VSAPVLLRAQGLGKAYPVNTDPRARLAALGRLLLGRDVARLPVVQDIGFEIRRGESLGVIGENGAGKSTLLKLLSGVLHPTSGQVERYGSIGALIELGAGFEMEHTGRHNIATSAALMGWSAAQVAERQQDIEAFADIGRYLDEPVKHYSSGMVVRLGFAIMATLRPDLLITDEVLAVGDESFQKKCIRWMEGYLEDGGTLLLVSHSMFHIQKLCSHALWLREGRAHAYGDVFDITQDYLAYHERKSQAETVSDLDPAYQGADYRVVAIELNGSEDTETRFLAAGAPLAIRTVIYTPEARAPQLGLGIVRGDGSAVFGTSSDIDGASAQRLDAHRVEYRVEFDTSTLLPGSYCLRLHALDPEGVRVFDTLERGFAVRGASRELGLVRIAHRWHGDGG
jgi:lipopolysaccharide transport system ATP-binding protein